MTQPAQWIKNKPAPPQPAPATRDYKPLFALIILIIGTLLLATGMFIAFGVPVLLITLGGMMVVVGLSLSYSKER